MKNVKVGKDSKCFSSIPTDRAPFLTKPTPSSGDMGKVERAAHMSLFSQETGERADSSTSFLTLAFGTKG